jgi:hypothetical protein
MKIMGRGLIILSYVFFVTSGMASTASPSLNATCAIPINTPSNATDVMFNESCTVAYVLPPEIGVAQVPRIARTTNLQFCSAVKSAGNVANRTFNSMEMISQRIENMILSFKPLDDEYVDLRIQVSNSKSKHDAAKAALDDSDEQLKELKKTIAEAKRAYEDCLYADDGSRCDKLESAYLDAKQVVRDFYRNEYRDNRDRARDAQEQFESSTDRMNEVAKRYLDAISPMLELEERLATLNHSVMELYKEYVNIEGATGQILWMIDWDELIDNYRALNPTLNIRWTRMPIKEAQLVSTAKIAGAPINLGITSLKYAVVPGAKPSGFAGMGSGEKISGVQIDPSGRTEGSAVFGSSVSGQIVLTLAGACPYFEGIEERTELDADELYTHMMANLVYTYEVVARRGYTANYNLSNLVSQVEKNSKSGGFFSTSHAHSLVENNDSESWFNIDFSENTGDFAYTEQEEAEITRTVKSELFDKAMQQFAILNAGPATLSTLPNHLASGADMLEQSLRRCYYWYCQVGSAIIGVMNSIWGSSEAVASFHRNNRSWVTERVNGIHFITRSGSLSFKNKD